MSDFVIQFAHSLPEDYPFPGKINQVYDAAEIVEPPSPNAKLAMLKLTGFSDDLTKNILRDYLSALILDDTGNSTGVTASKVDITQFDDGDRSTLQINKYIEMPADEGLQKIYSNILGRYMTVGDING